MQNNGFKKCFSILLCFLLLTASALPCFAQETQEHVVIVKTYTEDLGDGITGHVTIIRTQSGARSTVRNTKAEVFTRSGQTVGSATLTAQFYYDGSTSRATSASGSGSGVNGWSYGGQSTWTSGDTAYLSAQFSKNGTYFGVSLSLTCDENGNIS